MTPKTNLKTLKKVYRFLRNLGIENLIAEGKSDNERIVDFSVIIENLIEKDQMIEFLQIVTGNDDFDFSEMDFDEAIDIIALFFSNITKSFGKLNLGKMIARK